MTFEQFSSMDLSIAVSGTELCGMYLLLEEREESLDSSQSGLLSIVRSSLYEHLTVEQMECIRDSYTAMARTRTKLEQQ